MTDQTNQSENTLPIGHWFDFQATTPNDIPIVGDTYRQSVPYGPILIDGEPAGIIKNGFGIRPGGGSIGAGVKILQNLRRGNLLGAARVYIGRKLKLALLPTMTGGAAEVRTNATIKQYGVAEVYAPGIIKVAADSIKDVALTLGTSPLGERYGAIATLILGDIDNLYGALETKYYEYVDGWQDGGEAFRQKQLESSFRFQADTSHLFSGDVSITYKAKLVRAPNGRLVTIRWGELSATGRWFGDTLAETETFKFDMRARDYQTDEIVNVELTDDQLNVVFPDGGDPAHLPHEPAPARPFSDALGSLYDYFKDEVVRLRPDEDGNETRVNPDTGAVTVYDEHGNLIGTAIVKPGAEAQDGSGEAELSPVSAILDIDAITDPNAQYRDAVLLIGPDGQPLGDDETAVIGDLITIILPAADVLADMPADLAHDLQQKWIADEALSLMTHDRYVAAFNTETILVDGVETERVTGVRIVDAVDGTIFERKWTYDAADNIQTVEVVTEHDDHTVVTRKRLTGIDHTGEPVFEELDTKVLSKDNIITGSQIGSILGSTLGRQLAGQNQFAQLAAGSVIGAIGLNLGQLVDQAFDVDLGRFADGTRKQAFQDFGLDLGVAAAGAVSSFLVAELVNALGLDGVGGELANATGGAVVSTIAENLVVGAEPLAGVNAALLANAIGSFVGSKLANSVVSFDTIGGQIGASIGGAAGSIVGAKVLGKAIGGAFGGPIGALIGSFIGTLIGGLFGSLFGGTPRSGADVVWNEETGQFGVANVWSRKGGSRQAARNMATSAADTMNGVVEVIGGDLVNGADVQAGTYGMRKKDFTYKPDPAQGGGTSLRKRDAGDVLDHGLFHAFSDFEIAGGDIFMKRAFYNTLDMAGGASGFEVNTLYGNLTIASDYRGYVDNAPAINALIAADGESAFAAGWVATLTQARELNLHKRHAADWSGGWNWYLDAWGISAGAIGLVVDADTDERLINIIEPGGTEVLASIGDSIESASKDVIETTGDLTVSGDRIANTTGLTINGEAADGSAFTIDVAAVIRGDDGANTIRAGHLGNDVFGGGGNDILYGGNKADWLFGEAGNDTLYAGSNANGLDGGDGNLLHGGAGDDTLWGGAGSDWLEGGEGADQLDGGDGDDILAGGADGAAGGDLLQGGRGDDRYIFRDGDGQDTLTDEGYTVTQTGTTTVIAPNMQGRWLDTAARIYELELGNILANWRGGGVHVERGRAAGGEDTLVLGAGVAISDIRLRRSTVAGGGEGQDLILEILDAGGQPTDSIVMQNWFDPFNRIEWLEFADGQRFRVGDFASFTVGTAGDDVIVATSGNDFVHGGAGNDLIELLLGDDVGNGGLGDDFISGDAGRDIVIGGNDNDTVLGGSGADVVSGDLGDDHVRGDAGNDLLAGGQGDDWVVGGAGDDVIRYNRGDGHDTVFDAYSDNWELIFTDNDLNGDGQPDGWVDGVTFVDVDHDGDAATAPISQIHKDGVVLYDGQAWQGVYRYDFTSGDYRRHAGPDHAVVGDAGTDTLEFAIGIDINDVQFQADGDDLLVGIVGAGQDAAAFDQLTDTIRLKEWLSFGRSIEYFSFFNTGRIELAALGAMAGGTDGDDTVSGTASVDWLTGNAGDDTLSGGGANDLLNGNAGQDHLLGGDGNDVLLGGSGNDVLDGGEGADKLVGGAGFDIASYATATAGVTVRLVNQQAFEQIPSQDVFAGIEGLEGSAFADQLTGDRADNELIGGQGDDTLEGDEGDDLYVFDRGDGADVIRDWGLDTSSQTIDQVVDAGGSVLPPYVAHWDLLNITVEDFNEIPVTIYHYRWWVEDSTSGEVAYSQYIDRFSSAGAAPFFFDPAGWRGGFARTGNGAEVQRILGEATVVDGGEDALILGPDISLSDMTFTMTGQDLQIGLGQGDSVLIEGFADPLKRIEQLELADGLVASLANLVIGGAGTGADELLVGGGSADTLSGGDGADALSGGAGGDTLSGGLGNDALEGGLGADALDGGDGVDTARYVGSAAGVTVDLAAGTGTGGEAQGDTLTGIENVKGSAHGDGLSGDGGDNQLLGYGGNDVLDGRGGADVLIGAAGDDQLLGGAGEDNLSGGDGVDTLDGGDGADILLGGAGNDTLSGGGDADQLYGDDGNDSLDGGAGDDGLYGGAGADTLRGGAGADTLVGEAGNDTLEGGLGDDRYGFDAFSGADTILDSDGVNDLLFTDVAPDRLLFERAGADLIVSVLGGDTQVTLRDFYPAGTTAARIVTDGHTLYLAHAEPYLDLMAGHVPGASTVPQAARDALDRYWHAGGKAMPEAADQSVVTDEDVPLAGAIIATDHDDNLAGFSLAEDAAHGTVTLDGVTGAFTYTPDADYFGADAFSVWVEDADGQASQATITVDVAPVNDAPTAVVFDGTATIAEGQTDLALGTLTVLDVDDDQAEHTLSVDDARFEIVDNTLRLRPGFSLDHEQEASVTVRLTATDGDGASNPASAVTFTVTDVNEAPVVADQAFDVDEAVAAGTVVGTVAASDPDAAGEPFGDLTFAITGGNTGGRFTIDDAGVIRTAGSLNHEGQATYTLTVEARDLNGGAGHLADSATVTIAVNDVNEAPTDLAVAGTTVNENTANAVVGAVTVTDPDSGFGNDFADHAFSVDDARFFVDGAGQLRLKAGVQLDYETEPSITLAVTATDRGGAGLGVTRSVTIAVQDLVDVLNGGSAADTLTGAWNTDHIFGNGGNDTLYGLGGDDVIDGGVGHDQAYGGAGNDQITGGDGDDTLFGDQGADTLTGGAGEDHLLGGADADTLSGGANADRLEGGAGNDNLSGGHGSDVLIGGAGADVLDGGADPLPPAGGGAGQPVGDVASYETATTGVTIDLATPGANTGDAAGDSYVSIETFVGSDHADSFVGSSGADRFFGGAGDDTILGGAGNDYLYGGAGNDIIDAQAGDDMLDGGAGDDILIGGANRDEYRIDRNSGRDTIRNYDPSGAEDTLSFADDITYKDLWFARVGDDMVISVIGSGTQTVVEDWYLSPMAGQPDNLYKISLFLTSERKTVDVDAEQLAVLLADVLPAGSPIPQTQAAFDALFSPGQREDYEALWGRNALPELDPIGDVTVAEDGSVTFTIRAFDEEHRENLDFSVISADSGIVAPADVSFGAPDAAGYRQVTLTPRSQASGAVLLTIRAGTGGNQFVDRSFTIHVTPDADAPSLTVSNASGNTGGAITLSIAASLADTDGSEALSVEITGVPAGASLNKGTNAGGGVWRLTPAQLAGLAITPAAGSAADFALTVKAIATEAGNGDTAVTQRTLNVTVNGAPSDIAFSGSVSETAANGTVVGDASHSDPDPGGSHTYSLVNDAGGRFAINATSGVVTVKNAGAINHEAAASHTIRIRVVDQAGLAREENFTIPVVDVNETPTLNNRTLAVNENVGSGTDVGTLAGSDPDDGTFGSLRYYFRTASGGVSSTSVDGKFRINATTGLVEVNGSLNREAQSSYSYTMTVRDNAGGSGYLTDTATLTVNINNVNEAPSDIAFAGSVSEAAGNGTVVGDASHSDPEGGTMTYALTNSAGGRFAINATTGVVTVANAGAINYESASAHTIRIRVTDPTNLSREENFTVGVTNVNEAPDIKSLTGHKVAEGQANGRVVGYVDYDDPDRWDNQVNLSGWQYAGGGATVAGWSVRSGEARWRNVAGPTGATTTVMETGQFDTSAAGGGVYATNSFTIDPTKAYRFTVYVRKHDLAKHSLYFGLKQGGYVENISSGGDNNNPYFLAWNTSTQQANLRSDRWYKVVGYVLPQGHAISSNNSFGGVYDTVTGQRIANTVNYRWNAQRPNDQVSLRYFNYYNETVTGYTTFWHEPKVEELDASYSLTNTAGGRFRINSITGDILVNNGGALNYESASSHTITARVTDRGVPGDTAAKIDTHSFTINLTDVNEAPTISGKTINPGEKWNPANALTTVSFSDPDLGSTANGQVSLSIVSGNTDNYFRIDNAGRLWLNQPLDYEDASHRNFSLKVRARDRNGTGLYRDAWVYVNVQNQNESPYVTSSAGYTRQARFNGGVIGYVRGGDPDGDNLTYTITNISAGHGAPAANTYSVSSNGTISTSGVWWRQDHSSTHITVRISDPGGLSTSRTVRVRWVPDPNEIIWPIVLDMDGDGIELVSLADSDVHFDMNGDGDGERTGWVGADDALLALDRDGNGAIDNVAEISFIDDLEGAESDLEGLAAHDTNGNGLFDAEDARYGDFLLWRDANQDGVSQADELVTLSQAGIAAISLSRTLTGEEVVGGQDNVITATTEYARADGTSGLVGDVAFAAAVDGADEAVPADQDVAAAADQPGEASASDEEAPVDTETAAPSDGDQQSDLWQDDLADAFDETPTVAATLAEPAARDVAADARLGRLIQAMAAFNDAGAGQMDRWDNWQRPREVTLLSDGRYRSHSSI